MQLNTFLQQVNQLLNMELQQICMAARLAMFAPNELVRHKVLHFAGGELEEAMFLHHILCAYGGMAMPLGPPDVTCPAPCPWPGPGLGPDVSCPGVPGQIPGILPPAGPGATLPPSIPIAPPGVIPGLFPDIYPGVPYETNEVKEDEKKEK
ncbi:MAG: hypothetical protein ACOX0T_07135 [Pelotomaculum sp.]|jgi:hypothetical protein